MGKVPRVALVWRVERLYGSDAIRGVADYARRYGPWQFRMNQSSDIDLTKDESAELDGVILCQDHRDQLGDVIWPKNVPIVSLERAISEITPWQVLPDNVAVGQMVAEEFVKRGYRRFAYCRATDFLSPITSWDPDRFEGFRSVVRQTGVEPLLYEDVPELDEQYEQEIKGGRLADWLRSLPKPVGIMAPSDARARYVLLAAEMAGVRVPEEVAVIGVNNEPWAEITFRGLSSVELDGYRAGYAAADLLHKLIEKRRVPRGLIRIPPRRLVTRQSSDALAIDDPDVVTAVRFIAEHVKSRLKVADVVDAVPVSRRVLERRFHARLHRSILEEIHLAQVSRAKSLLADESLSLVQVAAMSGFTSARALSIIFRRMAGIPPSVYRAKIRASGESPQSPPTAVRSIIRPRMV